MSYKKDGQPTAKGPLSLPDQPATEIEATFVRNVTSVKRIADVRDDANAHRSSQAVTLLLVLVAIILLVLASAGIETLSIFLLKSRKCKCCKILSQ